MKIAWSPRSLVLWTAGAVCLAGLATTLVLGSGYLVDRGQRREEARAFAGRQAAEIQRTIDAEMRDQMAVATELAAGLTGGAIDPAGLLPALQAALDRKPNLFGLTAAFQPFAADPKQRLFAPYYRKDDSGAFVLTRIDSQYDYTDPALTGSIWYTTSAASGKPEWVKVYGKASGDTVVLYAVPFFRPAVAGGKPELAGVVAAVHSVNRTLRHFFQSLDLGEEGYAVMATGTGEIIFHPKPELLGKTYTQVAIMLGDEILKGAAPRAENGEDFVVERTAASGRKSWTFFKPLTAKGWSVAVLMYRDMLDLKPEEKIRRMARLIIAAIVFLSGLAALAFRIHRGTAIGIWGFSTSVGVSAMLGIAMMWYAVYANPTQNSIKDVLVNQVDIERVLKPLEKTMAETGLGAPLRIPTGVIVQNMAISTTSAVISGHLWQKFPAGYAGDRTRPPALINLAGPAQIRETYRFRKGNAEVVGWFFNATFSQRFDVGRYPLDVEIARLQVDPADYASNVVLVPAIEDYEFMAPSQRPGVAEDVWVPGWNVENSFFNYYRQNYNADFGGTREVRKNAAPGLTFNVRLSRGIVSPLIVYCIVIWVALILVFGLVVLPIENTFQVLSVCSALFLVSKIAHNSLRTDLNATGTVYLEYFFILLYVVIALASSRALSKSTTGHVRVPTGRGALILKALFWPVYFVAGLVITLLVFYPR
jgi:hypothetical protein